jgi:type IV pilus assembly protein PilQ
LRIATQAEIKAEEAEELKVLKDKNDSEPLKVRMYPISYAKVDDLSRSVQPFLSTRGKLVGDNRTNSLVVTDVSENLERIAQLIASLDIQPLQVLIEGKIVEAKEDFSRDIGIKWNFNGVDLPLGTSGRGPVNMRPSVSMSPPGFTGGALDFNLNIGTLDIFGNLGAALSISEAENRVKVISSPRILTLSNEQAQISQTTEVPIRTTTTVNSTTQSSFTFKPVNLKLDVTPQITADSAIIMKVAVSRQFLGANVGGASGDAQPVNSRDANTKVLVRNGETAVIGGIYTSDATEADAGVPWFKDIPFLGGLFRRTAETKNKSELIVFLTPRILEQAPAGKSEARLGSEGGGGSQ